MYIQIVITLVLMVCALVGLFKYEDDDSLRCMWASVLGLVTAYWMRPDRGAAIDA